MNHQNTHLLVVKAGVRYWEDASVNGVEDTEGSLIPFRDGDHWCPTIDIKSGKILNWPQGTTASIHYKVCDEGEYWLSDQEGKKIAKWEDYYVPDKFLCHGDEGYGDYIIMEVGPDGGIEGYKMPACCPNEWKAV